MLPWDKRTSEIAYLLNPAFCALSLFDAINEFQEVKSDGMPYAFSFLILPLTLHAPTREALPKTIATSMDTWLETQQNSDVVIGFPERARQLVPFTKEAIIFGMHRNVLAINSSGKFLSLKQNLSTQLLHATIVGFEYRERSKFLGRWLANAGTPATVFKIWGIQL